jgi:hypothetical protein
MALDAESATTAAITAVSFMSEILFSGFAVAVAGSKIASA